MPAQTLVLSPHTCPSFEQVAEALKQGTRITLSPETLDALDKARQAYEQEAEGRRVYGYCSGLGARWQARGECGPEWEARVVNEHARGTGAPAPPQLVRAFMLSRIIQASRAHAPLRPQTLERLVQAYNEGLTPQIPLHGSLGASGDLVPSAHLVQCIYLGKGWAHPTPDSPPLPCSDALERRGLAPEHPLHPGEALALINNTSWTSGVMLATVSRLDDLLQQLTDVVGRLLGLTGCVGEEFDSRNLVRKRILPPRLVAWLSRVECRETHRLQDPYSIRCLAHALAPLVHLMDSAKRAVEGELCSPGENPIVVEGRVYHGCHFYAGLLGVLADALSISVAHAINLLERLSSLLLDQRVTGLPEFLAEPGSPVGEMITHYTLASVTARSRTLASPSSVHSLPTSGGQEDIVPQSAEAALKLWEQAELLSMALGLVERMIGRGEALFMRRD